jgi:hypothetical protein
MSECLAFLPSIELVLIRDISAVEAEQSSVRGSSVPLELDRSDRDSAVIFLRASMIVGGMPGDS